uniref:replication initiation protein n=1 Tax=Flexibacterium corallicola TaxID=3037259 RepID=UPI00286EC25F
MNDVKKLTKTTQVAADRAYDQTKTVLPVEYAQGIYLQHAPSAEALKVMHFLIAKAGGAMASDIDHEFYLSEMTGTKGMRRHTRATLQPLFEELAASVLTIDDPDKKVLRIGGFLDEAEVSYAEEEESGELRVKWNFRKTFRRMAAESHHWAVIDRQTLFALSSKYSILLFQYFASLQGLQYQTSKRFSVDELRAILGVPSGKLKRFADLNRWALRLAIEEINQLARFTLEAVPHKRGRTVTHVEIIWKPKANPAKVKKELGSSKVGRKVRRNGTAETPIVAFPASGSLDFSSDNRWQKIARSYGNGKDIDRIAEDFRNWCEDKGMKLDQPNIEASFIGFCKSAGKTFKA